MSVQVKGSKYIATKEYKMTNHTLTTSFQDIQHVIHDMKKKYFHHFMKKTEILSK